MEKRLITLLTMLFLIVGGVFSQTKVNGTVLSQDDGQPVVGASVLVVGTQVGTFTDGSGKFSLNVPEGKKTLRITYVGMEPLEVSARPNMRIMLTSDQTALDEVIVVAYGTQKKSSFTGSAAVVGSEQIGKVQVTNAVDALKGKAAGVQINTSTGQPGAAPTIRIRGVNSINAENDPLIVLDGSPYDGSLNDINPTDVESMTVLKDAASTALYGARGGNGVILITTKSGKQGQGTQVTFDAKWGGNSKAIPEYRKIDNAAAYYETYYRGLNNYATGVLKYSPEQAWQWANNAMFATGTTTDLGYNVYTLPEGQMLIGLDGKLNPNASLGRKFSYKGEEFFITPDDWVDETYKNALRQEYTVSASASTDKATFYGSVNYLSNDGITEASDYKRLTSRLKASYQLKPWLKLTGNMSYGHYERNYLGDDGSSGSSGNAFALTSLAPIYPVYVRNGDGSIRYDENARINNYDYGDGSINGLVRGYLNQANPLSSNQLDTRQREGNTFNGTGEFEVRLPWDITFTSINNVYLHEYRYTNTTNPFFGQYASSKGQVVKEHLRNWSYNYQQRLNWRHSFGLHNVEVMAAHEYYRLREYELDYYMTNQFSVFNKELAGAVIPGSGSSYVNDYNTESWLGRVHYNFDERYFLQGSVMREASSRFAKDNRWGTFWSVGGGWLINKESFLSDADWLNELKLKASYGENGNDLIGNYQYVTYYNISNSNNSVSLVPSSLGNKDISWEKNAKFNVGVDFAMFNNRFWGSIEYYNHSTKDMLSWAPLPESFGFSGYYDNVGNMRNNGVEIDLHYDVFRTKDLTWNVYANLTTNHNEITKLADARKKTWNDALQTYGYSSGSFYYREGSSRYTYYTKGYAGVDPETGLAMYWRNVYEQRQSVDAKGNLLWELGDDKQPKLDADGNKIPVMETVYYDKDWNVIDNPDSYTGEKRRKIVDREKTTNYAEADYQLCGDVLPDVYGGFGTSFRWKDFDISVDFQYQLGGKIYDSSYQLLMGFSSGRAMHADLEDAWTPTNASSDIPRLQYNDTYMTSNSDRWLVSASYLSLQNITIGYTLPRKLTSRIGINKIRVYAVGDNLWVWSKRQGLDPRQSITGEATNAYYSSIRTISGGVSLTL